MANPATKVTNFYSHPKFNTPKQEIIDTSDFRGTVAFLQKKLFNEKTGYNAIAEATNLNINTISRLRDGITVSPHHRTTHALLHYYGYKMVAIK